MYQVRLVTIDISKSHVEYSVKRSVGFYTNLKRLMQDLELPTIQSYSHISNLIRKNGYYFFDSSFSKTDHFTRKIEVVYQVLISKVTINTMSMGETEYYELNDLVKKSNEHFFQLGRFPQ